MLEAASSKRPFPPRLSQPTASLVPRQPPGGTGWSLARGVGTTCVRPMQPPARQVKRGLGVTTRGRDVPGTQTAPGWDEVYGFSESYMYSRSQNTHTKHPKYHKSKVPNTIMRPYIYSKPCAHSMQFPGEFPLKPNLH
jgi:hypothetical protein